MMLKKEICRLALRLFRWRIVGERPRYSKYVLIAAPHTSYWDGVIMLALSCSFGLPIRWLLAEKVYIWPFRRLLRATGAIPVIRGKHSNTVSQIVNHFDNTRAMVLVIAPEGSRKKQPGWKSGFYRIAESANIPIVFGFIDYSQRMGGFGPDLHPSGYLQQDMSRIRAFYESIVGKNQAQVSPIEIMRR